MGHGASKAPMEGPDACEQGEDKDKGVEQLRPTVSCSSTTGAMKEAKTCVAALDLSECVNQQNTYLGNFRAQQQSTAKYFRVPSSDLMEEGDKKLLRCGGRAIAVFKLVNGWAALDNACYHHGGPLFMGDIEEYNDQTCVVCPWHCTKIAVRTGESLYESLDVKTSAHFPNSKQGGPRQRVHKVIVRDEDVLVKINDAPESSYASDRYAAVDIASNDETRMDPDSVDSEACGREKMEEAIRNRRRSISMERKQKALEKERKRNPVRVPAGRLTPRGKEDSGPYRPNWVRLGELPPMPGQEDEEEDWSPAFDLAEEFMNLEEEYGKRKEDCDKRLGQKSESST